MSPCQKKVPSSQRWEINLTAKNELLSDQTKLIVLIMAKRPVDEVEDGNQAYLKRQKISNPGKPTAPIVEIRSGRQLRQILGFDQDSGRSKQGKGLLETWEFLLMHLQQSNRSRPS
jgi:hypothetical protein